MFYELYIDSLFLVNFVMNLYLLILVNYSVKRTATRLRMIAAAGLGALVYCLMLVLPGIPALCKLAAGSVASSIGMIWLAFQPVSLKAFFKLMENLIGISFLFGGAYLFFLNAAGKKLLSLTGILGTGAFLLLFIGYLSEKRKRSHSDFCKAILCMKGAQVTIQALIDSGNGLVEPISGKPVSILDKSVLEGLWGAEMPLGFRAIPYHSVGCPNGIMKGYVISQLIIEQEGIRQEFRDIYVGVSEENIASGQSYRMILNPKLLEGEKKHDIKSGNTRRNTIQNDTAGAGFPVIKTGRHSLYRWCGSAAAAVRDRKGK